MGDVGEEGRKHRGGAAKADQDAMRDGKLPKVLRVAGGDVAEAEGDGAEEHGKHDAMAVGKAAGDDAAKAEAEQRERVGKRGRSAVDAELRLHGGKNDDHRPHADIADRADEGRGEKPKPCIGRVDIGGRTIGIVHGISGLGLGSAWRYAN